MPIEKTHQFSDLRAWTTNWSTNLRTVKLFSAPPKTLGRKLKLKLAQDRLGATYLAVRPRERAKWAF